MNAELDWPLLRDMSSQTLLLGLAFAIVATAALAGDVCLCEFWWGSLLPRVVWLPRCAPTCMDTFNGSRSLFYHKTKSGDLITRITSGIWIRCASTTVNAALPLVVDTLTLISMVVVMFWIDWELALIAMGILPLFLISSIKLTKRIKKSLSPAA